jgi:hypothetical protein
VAAAAAARLAAKRDFLAPLCLSEMSDSRFYLAIAKDNFAGKALLAALPENRKFWRRTCRWRREHGGLLLEQTKV